MKIKVADADIKKGLRRSPRGCALALAIARATGEACEVGFTYVEMKKGRIPLPGKAKIFREDFDGGRPVVPITFELDL